ncbi:MAG TPA: hypothetical protein VM223_07825, partial [Planctomycetota bacterium]|nr:hypothetical protein [Planctomycetota bacterium]
DCDRLGLGTGCGSFAGNPFASDVSLPTRAYALSTAWELIINHTLWTPAHKKVLVEAFQRLEAAADSQPVQKPDPEKEQAVTRSQCETCVADIDNCRLPKDGSPCPHYVATKEVAN